MTKARSIDHGRQFGPGGDRCQVRPRQRCELIPPRTDDEIEIFKWDTVIEVLLRLRIEQLRGEPGRRICQSYLICTMVTISIHHGSDPLTAVFLHFFVSKPSLILSTRGVERIVGMAGGGQGLRQKTVGIPHINC